MTCSECRDSTLEVARRRAAPFVERSVLAHTASCPGCRDYLAREKALSAGLQALMLEADGRLASPEVETRLMSAFAAQHGGTRATRLRLPWGTRWLQRAAAVVLCAAAAAWWFKTPPRVPGEAPRVASIERPVVARAVTPAAAPSTPTPDPRPAPRPLRTSRPRPKPVAPAGVQTAAFVAIPSAAGLPDFESGEIVRLGIPVTALPNYGLEIPSGTQSAIQADLLIGQDGQARAIRLVNATADGPRGRQ